MDPKSPHLTSAIADSWNVGQRFNLRLFWIEYWLLSVQPLSVCAFYRWRTEATFSTWPQYSVCMCFDFYVSFLLSYRYLIPMRRIRNFMFSFSSCFIFWSTFFFIRSISLHSIRHSYTAIFQPATQRRSVLSLICGFAVSTYRHMAREREKKKQMKNWDNVLKMCEQRIWFIFAAALRCVLISE